MSLEEDLIYLSKEFYPKTQVRHTEVKFLFEKLKYQFLEEKSTKVVGGLCVSDCG